MKTIVALSTPPMNGAIHIIRISGSKAFYIINKVTNKKIVKKGFCIQKAKILDKWEVIDYVLINTFVSPKSYTGEDLIEINCHGGYYLANKIIQLLIRHGCTLALAGEFTQRAYMNNKLSIHEAESINNLINATSEKAITLANIGLNVNTLNKLKQFRENLFQLIGQVEVNIDYPEFDDVPNITVKQFQRKIDMFTKIAEKMIENSTKAISIFEGIKVVIIGRPNVGKSSLFNALLNQPRAIVSNIPGTTRDMIDAHINLNGTMINLIDTAGMHFSKNEIEKMGIKKTIESLQKANLILWVIDGSKALNRQDKQIQRQLFDKKYIIVINKNDLVSKVAIKGIRVSAKLNKIDNLIDSLIRKLKTEINIDYNDIVLQSTTSIGYMQQIVEEFKNIKILINKKQPLDLTMQHLHEALINIDSILGKGKEYNFYNELFRKFCVGK